MHKSEYYQDRNLKRTEETGHLAAHIHSAYSGGCFLALSFFASWASAIAFSLAK